MCVGILPTERVLSAKAQGVGNALVLYGALTGRDGIGGASVLASQDLEGSDEKRPSVQIGDPFRGKALIEVSLDLVEQGLVVSLQDCGAAGLASSLSEMARDGMGVDVHLDRVPLREDDLEPWEIMISESQERMVAVVAPERVDDVRAVCERWELPCTVIGEVTDHGELRALSAARWSARSRPDCSPTSARATRSSRRSAPRRPAPVDPINDEPKTWVFEQYDHLVGSRTVRRPGLDAAVLRIDGDARHRRLARRPAARLPRPGRSRLGGRDGSRAQRRLRRRRAARPHRLPQLRQPREARDRLGARAGDRRDLAGGRLARDPRRLGERLALQRDRRRADPADAGRRLRRPRARHHAHPRPLAARRPRRPAARVRARLRLVRVAPRASVHAHPRRLRRRRRARTARGGRLVGAAAPRWTWSRASASSPP